MGEEDEVGSAAVVAGNVYDKYGTTNPVARWLMAGFHRALFDLVARIGASEAHEVGCGEGELAILLARRLERVRGSDLSAAIIAEARRRTAAAGVVVELEAKNLYDLRPPEDAAELVVCSEVLEHLPDPEAAVDVLAGLARPHLLASVPREPLWRLMNLARGRYLGALGNTPGHLQSFSRGGFLRLLERRFEVVKVATPIPWTIAWCRAQGTAAGRRS